MKFSMERALQMLERTPEVIDSLLTDLPDEWIKNNEGENTWSPYDIVGHLIHGEKTDWMVRMEIILSKNEDKTFEPFDRSAQFAESNGKSLSQLLNEFRQLRRQNIKRLKEKELIDDDFLKKGIHPDFGEVSLTQLLSAWVVHDLNHIAQISRVMAKQYKDDVGPWIDYLKILQ